MENEIIQGNCIEKMKEMEENSVDAVVTDPPYGLAFMGKKWDNFKPKEFQEFCQEWGEQALRVLKPGGHLLAFCGTRTYHRMVVGLEDAGFEIRDQIAWMYGSGFPKGQDISKAVDKELGKEDDRKVVDKDVESSGWKAQDKKNAEQGYRPNQYYDDEPDVIERTKAATDKAEKWEGWNTNLKPGHEPIVVAQKPKEGTYAENVLEYGVGGLNIDGCRISTKQDLSRPSNGFGGKNDLYGVGDMEGEVNSPGDGRWPTNIILDKETAEMLDEQSTTVNGGGGQRHSEDEVIDNDVYGDNFKRSGVLYEDEGGASRFFYTAKAQKSERNAGLEEIDNNIATLKPINLMRWLCRLITPKDGTVLDPFAGSGTTGCAAVVEGFDYILIEKRERFAKEIAPKRIQYWSNSEYWENLKDHTELPDTKEIRNGSLENFVKPEDVEKEVPKQES